MQNLTRFQTALVWVAQLAVAIILLPTLFFKFTAAGESVYIFSTIHAEPWGRIGSGVIELVASLLLLVPTLAPIGAALAMASIRYSNVEAFKAGADIAVVELNGVTAESTNIYDPAGTLLSAYRLLFKQWRIIFAIGAANRRAGAPASSLRRLFDLVRAHARREIGRELAD